jgi:hypothetical protein
LSAGNARASLVPACENLPRLRVCVRTGGETAGPSTALRSGRDDNSVGPLTAIRLTAFGAISVQQNCHPDRSAAQWRDLRFLFRFSRRLYSGPAKRNSLLFGTKCLERLNRSSAASWDECSGERNQQHAQSGGNEAHCVVG